MNGGKGSTVERTDSGAQVNEKPTSCEIIDCTELARRWSLPVTWVRDHVRARAKDPIPHLRFGKYVRFRWGSPELDEWLAARSVSAAPTAGRRLR
jgi:hypothetical protein